MKLFLLVLLLRVMHKIFFFSQNSSGWLLLLLFKQFFKRFNPMNSTDQISKLCRVYVTFMFYELVFHALIIVKDYCSYTCVRTPLRLVTRKHVLIDLSMSDDI